MARRVSIPRRSVQGPVPLASAQQRLWFLDQLQPGSPFYNISGALRLKGTLNIPLLGQALNAIVQRHEILRTRFTLFNGEPAQVISPVLVLEIPVIDLSTLLSDQAAQETNRLMAEESLHSFDLSQGTLLRVILLRLSPHEHVLLFTVHHIIADAWSLGTVLTQELATNYQMFLHGSASALPALPIQYTDFAAWQQDWLRESEQAQLQLAYWKQHLAGVPDRLELPTDHPRPLVQTFAGASYTLNLPLSLADALRALSQAEGVTLFMLLAAALNVLLHRYTGQTEILIGTPIANRTLPELEALIGFFANTLVLRTDLSGNPSFRELLRRVEQDASAAYAHQDIPFEKVVLEVRPQRDLSWSPLFQVMFAHNNTQLRSVNLPDLTADFMTPPTQTSPFDLTLMMEDAGRGLRGYFEYNTDLFEAASIARLATHFQIVLEGVVSRPDQRIGDLPLLTKIERQQILTQWCVTTAMDIPSVCMHTVFEAQVARTPDALAIVWGERRLTYSELNTRANYLACTLQQLGVGPEVRVGVCLERSPEQIIGILGVLKAGGAYVPLDPALPVERLMFMIEDVEAAVVVCQESLQHVFTSAKTLVVYIDRILALTAELASITLPTPPVLSPDNAAYIIYTSGSTGRPKGVIIKHRSMVNFVEAAGQNYSIGSGDRVLQFASISFDTSVEEIFTCLVRGATLVLRTDLMLGSIALFLATCQEWGVTVLNLPTAYWHELSAMLDVQQLELPSSLRMVIIGGEKALPDRLASWQRRAGQHIRLFNTYGPTESTVVATLCSLETSLVDDISIGRPLPNVQVYLLDRYGQPVPVGVPGEICIGGPGLARGYHNRPDLTAERFVPNPCVGTLFCLGQPGDRLYKTGDRARFRSDGNIEYLRRIDEQVKLRGYRIEPGEIEAVLRKQAAVREAVVVVREQPNGDKRLLAYLVPQEPGLELSAQELRQALREQLPEYMVPTAFLPIEALPLTASGKVDRRALASLAPETLAVAHAYAEPRTPLERQLAQIWAAVLGCARVGIHDNFFELGGHSLLAVQVLAHVHDEMQQNLSLGNFFQAQTVAEMALLLEGASDAQLTCLLPMKTTGTRPPLFCFHPVGGDILSYGPLVACLAPDQPCYALQSRALLGNAPELDSLEAMASEYVAAMRSQQPEGPYYLLGWSMGGVIACAVAAELEKLQQKVAFVALLDAYLPEADQPIDPLEGPGLALGSIFMQSFAGLSLEEQIDLRETLLALPEQDRFQAILSWGKERELIPTNFSVKAFESRAALANKHLALLASYEQSVIEAALYIWWADNPLLARQPQTDWRLYSRSGVQQFAAQGNHYSFMQQPDIQAVADQLEELVRSSLTIK